MDGRCRGVGVVPGPGWIPGRIYRQGGRDDPALDSAADIDCKAEHRDGRTDVESKRGCVEVSALRLFQPNGSASSGTNRALGPNRAELGREPAGAGLVKQLRQT